MIWNSDLMGGAGAHRLNANAFTTIFSAVAGKQSLGAHAHEYYPARDDANWRKQALAIVHPENLVTLSDYPVHIEPLTPAGKGGIERNRIAPKARVY